MKKFLSMVSVIILVLGTIQTGNAELIDRGGGLIYDTCLNITWLQDAGLGGYRMWNNAMLWADNLVYHDTVRNVDWSDWRLPDAHNQDGSGPDTGYNVIGSEMGHLYYTELGNKAYGEPGWGLINSGPFINLSPTNYWSSTVYTTGPYDDPLSWGFSFYSGVQSTDWVESGGRFTWAVRDGDVGNVPINDPPSLIELNQFNAALQGNQINITWNTFSELDNAGFNLWRRSENGPYIKINSALIEAEGGATLSAEYSFTDTTAIPSGTYYYKLEDIDTSGGSTFHGPVSATFPSINWLLWNNNYLNYPWYWWPYNY